MTYPKSVWISLFIFSAFFCRESLGQEKKTKDPRPRNAAIRSAILPGWGQAYNKRYWKIPVIYAAGATIGYFYYQNQKGYIDFRNLARQNPSVTAYKTNRDLYREWRDWNIVMFVGLYILQIIDANVDAHLHEFDVGEDLAFSIKPYLCPVSFAGRPNTATGLSFNIRFKR
jgi:hypothetical protein